MTHDLYPVTFTEPVSHTGDHAVTHDDDCPACVDELYEELAAELRAAYRRAEDLAQEARAGGRAVLAYHRAMTHGRAWTIPLRPSADHAYDASDADYQRRAKSARDSWSHGLIRPHWPIMRAAVQ